VIQAERGTKPAWVTSTSAGSRDTVVWKLPTGEPVPVSVRLASTLTVVGTGGVGVGVVGELMLGEFDEPPQAADNDTRASHRHGCIDPRTERTVTRACIGLSCRADDLV
jgi:hypothetical protein